MRLDFKIININFTNRWELMKYHAQRDAFQKFNLVAVTLT